MRTWITLALLALAVGASACGGSGEVTPRAEAEAPVSTPRSRATQRGSREAKGRRQPVSVPTCEAAGITAPPFNEGTCAQRGRRFVVANGRSLLKLKSLTAAIRNISVAESLPGHGQRGVPQGVFVLLTLKVKNRTGKPQRWALGQTQLMIADQKYEERTDVEGQVNPRSLASGHGALQPGAVGEGDVVFDVPLADVRRVTMEGMLYVANFVGLSGGDHPEIGMFRIYQR